MASIQVRIAYFKALNNILKYKIKFKTYFFIYFFRKRLSISKKKPQKSVEPEKQPEPDTKKFQQSYVMKLFDRSVDLSQFNENTPLYPICRAWIANQPHQVYNVTNNNNAMLVLKKKKKILFYNLF